MKVFPTAIDNGHSENQDGMDLRDYFAAKAMQGLFASSTVADEDWFYKDIASVSYLMANAMMKAREL